MEHSRSARVRSFGQPPTGVVDSLERRQRGDYELLSCAQFSPLAAVPIAVVPIKCLVSAHGEGWCRRSGAQTAVHLMSNCYNSNSKTLFWGKDASSSFPPPLVK